MKRHYFLTDQLPMYEKDLGISLLSSTSRVRITNEIDSDIRNTWIIGQMNCGFVSVFFFYVCFISLKLKSSKEENFDG
jgi:hypothetical protein